MSASTALSPSEFDSLVATIRSQSKQIGGNVTQGVAAIDGVLATLPGEIVAKVKGDLQKLGELVSKFLALIEPYLVSPGIGQAIWNAAGEWSDIAKKANDLAKDVDGPTVGAGDNWKGTAASAYETVRVAEQKAFGGVRTAAIAIADSLNAIWLAEATFYAALGVSAGALLGATIGLIGVSLVGFTIPAAVAAAVAVAAAELAFVGALLGGSAIAFASIKGQQTKIHEALAADGLGTDWPKFRPAEEAVDVSDYQNWAVRDPKA
jgi:hypothetical protein